MLSMYLFRKFWLVGPCFGDGIVWVVLCLRAKFYLFTSHNHFNGFICKVILLWPKSPPLRIQFKIIELFRLPMRYLSLKLVNSTLMHHSQMICEEEIVKKLFVFSVSCGSGMGKLKMKIKNLKWYSRSLLWHQNSSCTEYNILHSKCTFFEVML